MTVNNATLSSRLELNDPNQSHWVQVHPEVLDAAPRWARIVDLHFERDGTVLISYDLTVGSVEIGASAIWSGGTVTPTDGGLISVFFTSDERFTDVADLREFSRQFAAAADLVEGAL